MKVYKSNKEKPLKKLYELKMLCEDNLSTTDKKTEFYIKYNTDKLNDIMVEINRRKNLNTNER